MQYRVASVEHMEQMIPVIVELLANGQTVRIFPMGTSMLPMLRQGIDSVVLSPVPETLKKYDLPLYRRENGKYVLHRIIGAGNTYICMGDHQMVPEAGIRKEQMIAVVSGFYRNEKYYSVENAGYRLYCRFWYHSRHLRNVYCRGIRWIRRHLQ